MRKWHPFLAQCLLALLAEAVPSPLLWAQNHEKDNQKDDVDDEPVYDLAKDITPPRLIHQVNPSYDPGSRGIRVAGKVVIRLVVTSRGLPKNPTIIEGLGQDVDQSALDAVKQWRFDAAKRQGMPVAVRVIVEINFHPM
jgi:TonB family protein